jgi:hypothetical protein
MIRAILLKIYACLIIYIDYVKDKDDSNLEMDW